MDPTLADRHKAARIIDDLYRDYPPKGVSELLGVPRKYVWSARTLHKKTRYESYHCPKAVIAKILSVGAMLGARRSQLREAETLSRIKEDAGSLSICGSLEEAAHWIKRLDRLVGRGTDKSHP